MEIFTRDQGLNNKEETLKTNDDMTLNKTLRRNEGKGGA